MREDVFAFTLDISHKLCNVAVVMHVLCGEVGGIGRVWRRLERVGI
jgi:hypothetical protein